MDLVVQLLLSCDCFPLAGEQEKRSSRCRPVIAGLINHVGRGNCGFICCLMCSGSMGCETEAASECLVAAVVGKVAGWTSRSHFSHRIKLPLPTNRAIRLEQAGFSLSAGTRTPASLTGLRLHSQKIKMCECVR